MVARKMGVQNLVTLSFYFKTLKTNFILCSGAEGVSLEGKQVEIVAKDDITFRSLSGGVELAGGVVLDTVMLPHGGGGYKVRQTLHSPQVFYIKD